MKTTLITMMSLFMATFFLHAADSPVGQWEKSDKQGKVIIKIEKGKLNGYISGVKDAKRTHDTKNPNAKLRGRRLIGLKIISGFSQGADGKWTGGTVYDSSKGKTYKGKIWLENGKLMMRGFRGVSLIGKTATWIRVK